MKALIRKASDCEYIEIIEFESLETLNQVLGWNELIIRYYDKEEKEKLGYDYEVTIYDDYVE